MGFIISFRAASKVDKSLFHNLNVITYLFFLASAPVILLMFINSLAITTVKRVNV